MTPPMAKGPPCWSGGWFRRWDKAALQSSAGEGSSLLGHHSARWARSRNAAPEPDSKMPEYFQQTMGARPHCSSATASLRLAAALFT